MNAMVPAGFAQNLFSWQKTVVSLVIVGVEACAAPSVEPVKPARKHRKRVDPDRRRPNAGPLLPANFNSRAFCYIRSIWGGLGGLSGG